MYLKRQKLDVALHSLHREKRLCRCLYILFLTAASFADVCIFSVPPPSLGIEYLSPLIGGISTDYQLLIFADFTFFVGK